MNAYRKFLTCYLLSIASFAVTVALIMPQDTHANATLLMTPKQLAQIEQQAQAWCTYFAPRLTPKELQKIATELYFLQGAAILDAQLREQMHGLLKSIENLYTRLPFTNMPSNDNTDEAQTFNNKVANLQKTLFVHQTINQSLNIASEINDNHYYQHSTSQTESDSYCAPEACSIFDSNSNSDSNTDSAVFDQPDQTQPITTKTNPGQSDFTESGHMQFVFTDDSSTLQQLPFSQALQTVRAQGSEILQNYALQRMNELETKITRANQVIDIAHKTLTRYTLIHRSFGYNDPSSETSWLDASYDIESKKSSPDTSTNYPSSDNGNDTFDLFSDIYDPLELYVGLAEDMRENCWSMLASAADFANETIMLETLACVIFRIYYTTLYTYMQEQQLDDQLYIAFAPNMPLTDPTNMTYDLSNLVDVNRAVQLKKIK